VWLIYSAEVSKIILQFPKARSPGLICCTHQYLARHRLAAQSGWSKSVT